MAIAETKLRELLNKAFANSEIIIKDLVGDGDHYEVIIKSADFNNKSRVQQHRMVNQALTGYLGDQLHALSIKTQPSNKRG